MSHSKAHHRAVGEVHRALYEALAKGAPAHDKAAVLVLDSPRRNLSSRCRELIDEHHDAQILQFAVAMSLVGLLVLRPSLRVNDHIALAKELIHDGNGRDEQSATIVLKV